MTEEVSRGQGNNFSLLAVIENSSLGTITFEVFLVTFWADVPGIEARSGGPTGPRLAAVMLFIPASFCRSFRRA